MNTLMVEAYSLITGDRKDAYGQVENSFEGIADVWTGLLKNKLEHGQRLAPEDVALMMTGLKLARETNQRKRDNIVDAHGYLALHAQIVGYL